MTPARLQAMTTGRQWILGMEVPERAVADKRPSITTSIDRIRLPVVEIVENSSNTTIIARIVVGMVVQLHDSIMQDAVQEAGLLSRQVVDEAANEVLQRKSSGNPVVALLVSSPRKTAAATCTVGADPARA